MVTGASAGIGAAIVKQLISHGKLLSVSFGKIALLNAKKGP